MNTHVQRLDGGLNGLVNHYSLNRRGELDRKRAIDVPHGLQMWQHLRDLLPVPVVSLVILWPVFILEPLDRFQVGRKVAEKNRDL